MFGPTVTVGSLTKSIHVWFVVVVAERSCSTVHITSNKSAEKLPISQADKQLQGLSAAEDRRLSWRGDYPTQDVWAYLRTIYKRETSSAAGKGESEPERLFKMQFKARSKSWN